MNSELSHTALGKTTEYPAQYNPELLCPIERQRVRQPDAAALMARSCGADIWTAFELSWLNSRGVPQAAAASFSFDLHSPCLVESKSFKLYLNAFNMTRIASLPQLTETIKLDLERACGAPIDVDIRPLSGIDTLQLLKLPGDCIDHIDCDITQYEYDPGILQGCADAQGRGVLHSHLLKSNCPVTGQPDWGSIVIAWEGGRLEKQSLLRYIVSFRNHNGFHEDCAERVYTDLHTLMNPRSLFVWARYTRRGGLDINPWRASSPDYAAGWLKHDSLSERLARQ